MWAFYINLNMIYSMELLFCQAFFNRFLEVFINFLKYTRKRAKSQVKRGLTSLAAGYRRAKNR